MTLRWKNTRNYYVVPDVFVAERRGWYVCNGLSITTNGKRVERNEHKVTGCLALAPNLAVVVTESDDKDRCVLLQKGQEKMPITIRSWGQEAYLTRTELFLYRGTFESHPALQKWYDLSKQTIEMLLSKNVAEKHGRDTYICAAGHQWLIWERAIPGISIGNGQTIWGSISLPAELHDVDFDLVAFAPIQKGWLIQYLRGNVGLALLWNGNTIKQQSIFIPPCVEWEEQNSWRYWRAGGAILTPSNNIALVPADYHDCLLKTAHSESAFFITSAGGAFSVHQSGHLSVCFPNKLSNRFAVGKTHCMLYQDALSIKVSPFVIVRIDEFPCKTVYELEALPDHIVRFVEVLRGNPETFVILFACSEQQDFPLFRYVWDIAFISTDGRMKIVPSVLESSGLPLVINQNKRVYVYTSSRNANADLYIEVNKGTGIIHKPSLGITTAVPINQPLTNWSQVISKTFAPAC